MTRPAEELRAAYALALNRYRAAEIQEKVARATLHDATAASIRADAAHDAAAHALEHARKGLIEAEHALTCPGCSAPASPKPTVN